MNTTKKIHTALVSVYNKDGLAPILELLAKQGVTLISTGGTHQFITDLGLKAIAVEDITEYPSIFGGRVKTLHPRIFGGILHRRSNEGDLMEREQFQIPAIDLVIVDLYPFEETVKQTTNEADIIEKIDIGGVSLIRAAAKNFADVLVCAHRDMYAPLATLLQNTDGFSTVEQRKIFATQAFATTAHYDAMIQRYFEQTGGMEQSIFSVSAGPVKLLRYGENPHQKGWFYGDFASFFDQLHGKEISYNNLLDIEAAVKLIHDFDTLTFAILKHNNACGVSAGTTVKEAYEKALAGDPLSAFGGVLITNAPVDEDAANAMNSLFFEVCIAPAYSAAALELLREKKNRMLLVQKSTALPALQFKSLLNGVLVQETDSVQNWDVLIKNATNLTPSKNALEDLIFANRIVKNTKSNAIVLVKNKQLIGVGTGHTSRVDAVKHAIGKAKESGFDVRGSVLASDAFFPFADSLAFAKEAGIEAIIQPGGSVRDQETINFCNENNMAMVFTGTRHFKH